MAAPVLSQLTRSDFTSAILLTQMSASFVKRVAQETANISDSYQKKINSINQNADKWRKVEDSAGKAVSKISGVIGRAKSMLSKLDSMIYAINNAERSTAGDTNYEGYASTFDSLLKGLNTDANSSRVKPNLLGEGTTSFEYQYGVYGETQTLNGSFLGSDYYITDTAGKRWVPDRSAKLLMRYDNYPDDPLGSDSANFKDGLQVDSISGNAVSFTVGPNTGTPQSFSGTITRSGAEVLDSMFYDGLATSSGRTLALSDLDAAKETVNIEIRRYEISLTLAKFYEERAIGEAKGQSKKTNDLYIERAMEVNKAKQTLKLEFRNAQSKVARAMALKNDYINLLAPFMNSKFAKAFVNIFA